MILTEEQIKELYIFTRKHFVEHYDLQTELVDHLANGIEKQWETAPSLTFQEALNREFKKFGIFGFQDVVGERMKAMHKKYRAIIWRFYKEYFKLPKILLILCLSMVYFSILRKLDPEEAYFFFFATMFLSVGPLLIMNLKFRKKIKSKKRKWLLEEMIFNQMGYFNLFLLPIHILNLGLISHRLYSNPYYLLGFSFVVVCYIIMIYVMIKVIPPKAEQLLSEAYPEYKMV